MGKLGCFFLEGISDGVWFWIDPKNHPKQLPYVKGILLNYQKAVGEVTWQNSKEGPAGLECLDAFPEENVKRQFYRDWSFVEIAAYLQETQE